MDYGTGIVRLFPRRCAVLLGAISLIGLGAGGCKKRDRGSAPGDKPAVSTNALAADKAYAEGKVEAAVLRLRTTLDVPGLVPEGKVDELVRKAREDSAMVQTVVVDRKRGKMTVEDDDLYLPKGTELRFSRDHGKYALCDKKNKQYWALDGGELGNLLEGGPAIARDKYTISFGTISSNVKPIKVAGFVVKRTEAQVTFHWTLTSRKGKRQGDVKVNLVIWHTADKRLKPAWAETMVDFLTVPFADHNGAEVVRSLKKAVAFPVKWSMEVIRSGGKAGQRKVHPKLVTVAQKLEVKQVAKPELASPPAGFAPAKGPYEFGEGKQTVSEDVLRRLPARKGQPPKAPPAAADTKAP